MYKTPRLVRISLLINALNKRVLPFFSGTLFYKSNRKRFFLCLHILIQTLEGLGECSTVMQTLDFVSGSHNCSLRSKRNFRAITRLETLATQASTTVSNSPNPSRVYIRLCNTENVFYCLVRRHHLKESPNVIEPAKLDGDVFVLFQQITLKRRTSAIV